MGERGRQEDRNKAPLERVTGEDDVHPEEERKGTRTGRQSGTERGRKTERSGEEEDRP
ncbi:hypothetical protein AB0A69_06690 [Streptomyces sp. NPDC045431]|uniref:hypothetical protein n=1 Tax=Streptomyces sp. NPDC045431 TaxID=3155613 RepID=UPI0033C46596